MEIQSQNYQEFRNRLEKLEQHNWWLKALLLSLFILFLSSFSITYFFPRLMQDKLQSQTVKARKFFVVDNQGKTVAVFGDILNEMKQFSQSEEKDNDLSLQGILLLGKDGKPRLCLGFASGSPDKNQEAHFLVFVDQNNAKRLEILNHSSQSAIRIYDENAKVRAGLQYDTSIKYKSGEKIKTSSIFVDGDSSHASLQISYTQLLKESMKLKKPLFGEIPSLRLSCNQVEYYGPGIDLRIEGGKYPILSMEKNIGFIKDKSSKTGEEFINEEKMLIGFDDINTPSVKLYDKKQNLRAILGSADLVKATGTQIKTPLSSLVFFNEKGNVIWKAPLE
jgi:hypothetical protein